MNCYKKQFLILILSKNKLYCRSKFYRTFFESYSIREQILMHKGIYQLLYYTFLDFCSCQEQTRMFHYFLELLHHTFVESYINQEHILIDKVFFNCMLTHFMTFRAIRNKFYYFWISHYCSKTCFYRFIGIHTISLSTILNNNTKYTYINSIVMMHL